VTSVALGAELRAGRLGALLPAALGAATAGFVGAAGGGYFETSWGWSALFLLWGAALALMLGRPLSVTRAQVAVFVALAGLLLWTLASVAWAPSAGAPVREAERLLVYVSAALAVPLIVRRSGAAALLGGLLAGITAVATYGLATRLFPDRLGSADALAGYRLAEPLGYWNALGIFAALGILLALGLAARAGSQLGRASASAATVPLALALYFTFSRGGWIALGIGLVVVIALDSRRLQLLTSAAAAALAPAVAIAVASRYKSLTTPGSDLHAAAQSGGRLALIAIALAAAAALASVAIGVGERRWVPSRTLVRVYAGGLLAILVAASLMVVARYGAPWTIAERGWSAFSGPPKAVAGNLDQRLLSFSGSGRVEQWNVALDARRSAPLLGIGSGGYERYWLQHRKVPGKIRDAHNLYVEQLAELGPLGLALLVLALGVPVYAAFRARRRPLVPAALGAYVAYLVHAGVDWDWEMTAVTLTALLIGASIVIAARPEDEELRPMSPRLRYGLLAGTLALAAAAFVGLVGNMALSESGKAARAGSWAKSESQARRAATWAPWSPEPWRLVGEAQLARGTLADARESFRRAIGKNSGDWNLWFDLARASEGRAQLAALAHATKLDPLSPEIATFRSELGSQSGISITASGAKP